MPDFLTLDGCSVSGSSVTRVCPWSSVSAFLIVPLWIVGSSLEVHTTWVPGAGLAGDGCVCRLIKGCLTFLLASRWPPCSCLRCAQPGLDAREFFLLPVVVDEQSLPAPQSSTRRVNGHYA